MAVLSRLWRLFHTVRYLRWRQVWFRLYYRVRPLRVPVAGGARPRGGLTLDPCHWGEPATGDGRRFDFLGESGEVATAADWNAPRFSKLWLYNLHYLNDLNAVGADQREALNAALVDRWIEENPPCQGNGWEPYPLSLRLVNLVKWFARGGQVPAHRLDSLATQARALERQVEWPILGNHLFANGKALVFVGAYLAGEEGDRWLRRGLAILDREIAEQFLADGGHFERSPMYHDALLWDLCDLIHLAERAGLAALSSRRRDWLAVLERGLHWSATLRHPDGDIAFFNDAAFGIAPSLDDLRAYHRRLADGSVVERAVDGTGTHYFADSGYAALDLGPGHRALLDLAPVGPDYQPGHAHADTLSFELSLFGRRLLVNSGTSRYGVDRERLRQRATAAHNTVEVDGQDSSEVWSGFRVARRARPTVTRFENEGGRIHVSAGHDGYRRLAGDNVHYRDWQARPGELLIQDRVSGAHGQAVARFHLHPDVQAQADGDGFVLRLSTGGPVRVHCRGADRVTLEPASWHPTFGGSVPNQCIVAAFSGGVTLETAIVWQDHVDGSAV